MDLGRLYYEGDKKLNKTNNYENRNDVAVKTLENQVNFIFYVDWRIKKSN